MLAEILVGLSMLGGLFTPFAGAVSLLLLAMFTTTTGLYLSSFWMVFSAVAVLTAGRVFGFDYYTSPLLKGPGAGSDG